VLPFDPFSPASIFDGVKILASGFQELFQRNEKPKVVLNFLGPPHGKGEYVASGWQANNNNNSNNRNKALNKSS